MTFRLARVLGRPNVGGPTMTVLRLDRCLREQGVETLLLVGESGVREGDLLAAQGDLPVERIAGLRRRISFRDLAAYRSLRRALERFRPDIVHTHGAKAGALGRLGAGRLTPRPLVVHTFHGHVLTGYYPRPVSFLFAGLERLLARRADCLVAVSDRVADELAGRFQVSPRSRFRVIENGIDLSLYRHACAGSRRDGRVALGVGGAARVILVPARLVPVKQHRLLFRALQMLPPAVRPLEVHLVGDGPLRGVLERQAAALPRDIEVRFHGFRDDLPRLLPAADLVVLASRNEGMPLALIEAMASAVPVVATAVGGVPDLLKNGVNGLLATPGDAASLAFAMGRILLDLGLARRLGAGGRRCAMERHGFERVVKEHLDLYRSLLALRGA